jgi:hypothetical protein
LDPLDLLMWKRLASLGIEFVGFRSRGSVTLEMTSSGGAGSEVASCLTVSPRRLYSPLPDGRDLKCRQLLYSDIQPHAIDSVCKLWTNLNLKDYAVAKLIHLPGREREMAATVASGNGPANPGGLPLVATLSLLTGKGLIACTLGSQPPATRSPFLPQGDRSLAVSLHDQYLPGERDRSLVSVAHWQYTTG